MHRNETVEELKQQIAELQARLDAGGRSVCEMHLRSSIQDIRKAAAKLKTIRNELSSSNCASEVANSLGVLCLGGVLTYWLKTSLKTLLSSFPPSPAVICTTFSWCLEHKHCCSTSAQIDAMNCCKLRKVLLDNPKAVDELLQALAVLDQRINSTDDASGQPPSARQFSGRVAPGQVRDSATAMPGISTAAAGPVWDEATAASPLSGSEDMVHLVPSDWESPTRSTQHPSRITFNQAEQGIVPSVVDGDDAVHVSTAGSAHRTGPVVNMDEEHKSEHVMMTDNV